MLGDSCRWVNHVGAGGLGVLGWFGKRISVGCVNCCVVALGRGGRQVGLGCLGRFLLFECGLGIGSGGRSARGLCGVMYLDRWRGLGVNSTCRWWAGRVGAFQNVSKLSWVGGVFMVSIDAAALVKYQVGGSAQCHGVTGAKFSQGILAKGQELAGLRGIY